jgi:hypothetical protein
MKIDFYMDISEAMWDYNLDCAEGREHKILSMRSKPNAYKSEGFDTIKVTVSIPDRYFQPRKADYVAIVDEVEVLTDEV